jgi:DNA-binding transcriptional ArsR family regulator
VSVELMGWAYRQTVGSPTRKAVLVAVADAANGHTGKCCPSVEHLAEMTELDESTVRRALVRLVEDGYLARTRRRRPDGSLGVYDYTFPHTEGGRTRGPDHRAERPVLPGRAPARPPGRAPGQEEPEVQNQKENQKNPDRAAGAARVPGPDVIAGVDDLLGVLEDEHGCVDESTAAEVYRRTAEHGLDAEEVGYVRGRLAVSGPLRNPCAFVLWLIEEVGTGTTGPFAGEREVIG